MDRNRKLVGVGSVVMMALLPLLVGADVASYKVKGDKITGKALMAAGELKWAPLPGIDGAEQAVLWGDPAKEAHRAIYKYPVGLKSPVHTHSYGDRGVVLSGTLSLAVDGAPAKKLPPGSYFSLSAGTKHITAVEGDAPCVFYVEREGPFDVVVDPAGAK